MRRICPNRQVSRRSFLGSVGATVLCAAGVSGTATGETELPLLTTGMRIHQFKPTGNTFIHRKEFVSQALAHRYGTNRVEFTKQSIPRDRIPRKYRDPDRNFTIQYHDSAIIGTLDEHVQAEKELLGFDSLDESVGATNSNTYVRPLYVYESASGAENQTVSERTGPINVAWNQDVNKDSSGVKTYMKNRGWDSTIPDDVGSNDRYVAILSSTGSYYSKVQDADVAKYISLSNGGEQWHVRLYNIGGYRFSNHVVCGQAHRDPWDHGIIYRWSGDRTQEPDYRFNDSREEVTGDWDSWGWATQTESLGNGMEGHDGDIGKVYDT